ncbi:MAG: non-homologous end-joining DNA ligase [Thermoplasmata archaeon]|nr:non-homologous end-joining DNA ligase [Thermoplasmata archaeon]
MFMLAKMGDTSILKNREYIFEPKLDGTRAILIKDGAEIRFVNRRGYNITRRYPELNLSEYIKCEKCILDGEIIVYNSQGLPDFHLLQLRDLTESSKDIKIRAEIYPATYVVFDILEKDGENLRDLDLMERKSILKEVMRENERIQIIPYMENGEKLWEIVKKLNIEGIMAKRKDSRYREGRYDDWLKIKYFKTVDAVTVGYTPGKGKREETFGALLLALYEGENLRFVGKVGTGFDESISRYLLSHFERDKVNVINPPNYEVIWVKPNMVCEVQYLEVTEDKKLRAPSFKRVRWDKNPKDCKVEELQK